MKKAELNKLMKKYDLKSEQLAAALDVSVSSVWNWRGGKTIPVYGNARRLRNYFENLEKEK